MSRACNSVKSLLDPLSIQRTHRVCTQWCPLLNPASQRTLGFTPYTNKQLADAIATSKPDNARTSRPSALRLRLLRNAAQHGPLQQHMLPQDSGDHNPPHSPSLPTPPTSSPFCAWTAECMAWHAQRTLAQHSTMTQHTLSPTATCTSATSVPAAFLHWVGLSTLIAH
jgi:hypothetical protein